MVNNDKISKFVSGSTVEIQQHVLMSDFTYTRVGGIAQYLAQPKSLLEMEYLVQRAIAYQIPYTLLGNASNVIISDQGLKGLVIIVTELKQVQVKGNELVADAGASLKDIAQSAARVSLTGFEFACGIPGTLGGAIFMNAGAYGGEISHVIKKIKVIDSKGKIRQYDHDQFKFAYRHSLAQEQHLVILQAILTLSSGKKDQILNLMADLNARRASKQPLDLPSCGSVFRRPVGHYVGPMIQECGLQGKQIGGAQVSKKHAGFIVNIDHASASDYLDLIALIQEKVLEKFGVDLKPEVRFLGFDEQSKFK